MSEYKSIEYWMGLNKFPGETLLESKTQRHVFRPYYRVNISAYGTDAKGGHECFNALAPCWKILVPPKKKIKKWQWANVSYSHTSKRFLTEYEAKQACWDNKLPWTEIEVDG